MKVYVRGYWPRDADKVESPKRPFERIEDTSVDYSKGPDWRIAPREMAESELRILTDMRVHVDPHHCEFTIRKTSRR